MPDDDRVRARFAGEVLLILDDLGPAEAEALHLIYFRGLTQAQAARVLGTSRAAVGGRVARGARELADRLLQTP